MSIPRNADELDMAAQKKRKKVDQPSSSSCSTRKKKKTKKQRIQSGIEEPKLTMHLTNEEVYGKLPICYTHYPNVEARFRQTRYNLLAQLICPTLVSKSKFRMNNNSSLSPLAFELVEKNYEQFCIAQSLLTLSDTSNNGAVCLYVMQRICDQIDLEIAVRTLFMWMMISVTDAKFGLSLLIFDPSVSSPLNEYELEAIREQQRATTENLKLNWNYVLKVMLNRTNSNNGQMPEVNTDAWIKCLRQILLKHTGIEMQQQEAGGGGGDQ